MLNLLANIRSYIHFIKGLFMNIKDVISGHGNGYHAQFFPGQVLEHISNYVFSEDKDQEFVVTKNIPGFMVGGFFKSTLPELKDDDLIIGRYLYALFASVKERNWHKDNHWICDIKIDQLLHYVPDFYQRIKTKREVMDILFREATDYSLCDGLKYLERSRFSQDEIVEFIGSEQHLTDGLYNYSNNLYLYYITFPKLKKAYQCADSEAFDTFFIEFLRLILNDYCKTGSMPGKRIKAPHYRTSLPESEVECFIDLVKGQGDIEKGVKQIADKLVKKDISDCGRISFTLLHSDEDFKSLIDLVFKSDAKEKLAASKYLDNFTNIIRLLDANLWFRNSFSDDCFCNCSFDNAKSVLTAVDSVVKQYPEMEDDVISFVVEYLSDHYPCCLDSGKYSDNKKFEDNVHLTLLSSLVDRYDVSYVWKCFDASFSYRPEIFYSIVSQFSQQDKSIVKCKQAADIKAVSSLIKLLNVDASDEVILEQFILDGHPSDRIESITLDIEELPEVYWLDEVYLERLAQLFFNGKNPTAANQFILEANQYHAETPLRLLSNIVINTPVLQPAYLQALSAYTNRFVSYGGVGGRYYQRYYRIEYHALIPQLEFEYLQQHGVEVVKHIVASTVEYKSTLLACLVGTISSLEQALPLTQLLKEKNKGLLEEVFKNINALSLDLRKEFASTLIAQLNKFKGQNEINAITAICSVELDKETALRLMEQVGQSLSRALLADNAGIDFSMLYKTADGEFDLSSYLSDCYKPSKKPLVNEDISELLRSKQGGPSSQVADQLLQVYQSHEGFTVNNEAKAIISVLEQDSFQNFNANILATYLDKITAKNRWLLTLPAIHGNSDCIKMLSSAVEKWASGAKHQLAAHVIKQLGASGDTHAYVAIERIGRNSKKQSVKDAVDTAFAIGASIKGITKDQLGDTLVEDIGFVGDEIPLRYCEQDYALLLTKELKFSIRKPDGKIAKSLPKPKVSDDSDAAAIVAKDFMQLKKLLKGVVDLQSHRLENAFVIWRHWSSEQWNQLFLHNPVMNKLASRVVWGLYQDNRLVKAFTVNPKPIDLDDNGVTIDANCQVGLVHRSELEGVQCEQWLEYFDDWGIELLFEQLNSGAIEMTSQQDKLDYQVKASKKSPSTVINRLRKKGWAVGSVRDAGSFDELYKEIDSLNVGIEITFDDSVYHGGYGYECNEGDITIAKVQFYNSGAIERGSYCYDELEETNSRIDQSELPLRVTQELVREAIWAFS